MFNRYARTLTRPNISEMNFYLPLFKFDLCCHFVAI